MGQVKVRTGVFLVTSACCAVPLLCLAAFQVRQAKQTTVEQVEAEVGNSARNAAWDIHRLFSSREQELAAVAAGLARGEQWDVTSVLAEQRQRTGYWVELAVADARGVVTASSRGAVSTRDERALSTPDVKARKAGLQVAGREGFAAYTLRAEGEAAVSLVRLVVPIVNTQGSVHGFVEGTLSALELRAILLRHRGGGGARAVLVDDALTRVADSADGEALSTSPGAAETFFNAEPEGTRIGKIATSGATDGEEMHGAGARVPGHRRWRVTAFLPDREVREQVWTAGRKALGALAIALSSVLVAAWFFSGWVARRLAGAGALSTREANTVTHEADVEVTREPLLAAALTGAARPLAHVEWEGTAEDDVRKTSPPEATVGSLAAGVAHEINNPLTYLFLNLEAMQRLLTENAAALPVAVAERAPLALENALDGAQRVAAVVSELRAFSREQEKFYPVDVNELIRRGLDGIRSELPAGCRLTVTLGEVHSVFATEERLLHVLGRLLANARRALTEEGAAERAELRVTTSLDRAGCVVVEVSDTGPGIPKDHLARLFEPPVPTRERRPGAGLGLFMCRHIVTELDGELSVSSHVGHGATFRVVLPASQIEHSPSSKSEIRSRWRESRLPGAPEGSAHGVGAEEPAVRPSKADNGES